MRYLPQLAVAALAASLAPPALALAGPPRYDVTIVGEGSPLAYRASNGTLSSNGQVAGTLNFGSHPTAFRWDGQLAAIGSPPDVGAWGYGINASGTVVGSLELGGISHPFLSRPGAPAQPFAPLGSAEGIAWDINDDGWVVGGVGVPGAGVGRAFRWRDGVSEELLMPVWASAAAASIIAPGGDIYGIATDGAERIQPVMWTASGMTELPSLAGWDWTVPIAATDGGLAVGNATNHAAEGAPVVWEDGQIRVLPHDPASQTYVSGVNAAGDIVGSAWDSDARALLWSGGEVFDLQDLVPVSFAGKLVMVRDINDRGQILATAWFDGPEADRTVVLTPVLCYADCDGSGSLDFFDFLCFQNEFAAGATFADCDESAELDFFDFLCFQDGFAAGCS